MSRMHLLLPSFLSHDFGDESYLGHCHVDSSYYVIRYKWLKISAMVTQLLSHEMIILWKTQYSNSRL